MLEINKIIAIGNLGKDPEVTQTPNGTSVAKFSLAINRSWKNQQGDYDQATTWVDVTVWGKTAEFCGQYLQKGARIYIEGRLDMDKWQDKETGANRQKVYITADRIQFAESKQDNENQNQNQQGTGYSRPQQTPQQPQGEAETAEDLPF